MTEARHRGAPKRVSPGPDRWRRAAANAVERPNSQAARLYFKRVSLAYKVSEECRNSMAIPPLTPYAFMDWRDGEKRDAVTCSVFCTVMHVQLRMGASTLVAVSQCFSARAYMTANLRLVQLDRSTLKRAARCEACGSMVKPS